MSLLPIVDGWVQSFSSNPNVFFMQLGMVAVAVTLVFIVLFTTRDVLIRSSSLLFQFFSIVLVAVLPIIGFLLYLIIRPAHTNKERALAKRIDHISSELHHIRTQLEQRKQHQQGNQKQQSHGFKMHPKIKQEGDKK